MHPKDTDLCVVHGRNLCHSLLQPFCYISRKSLKARAVAPLHVVVVVELLLFWHVAAAAAADTHALSFFFLDQRPLSVETWEGGFLSCG